MNIYSDFIHNHNPDVLQQVSKSAYCMVLFIKNFGKGKTYWDLDNCGYGL